MTIKYDYALSQFPGKIIVVHCDTCDIDYDVREVTNEVQHLHALHVMAFDCPEGAPLRSQKALEGEVAAYH
jgi:hypothetical protein